MTGFTSGCAAAVAPGSLGAGASATGTSAIIDLGRGGGAESEVRVRCGGPDTLGMAEAIVGAALAGGSGATAAVRATVVSGGTVRA